MVMKSQKGDGASSAVQPKGKLTVVVLQRNGKWGVQIYANHERIWLGTFNSEKEAALAYDRASIKLKGKDGPRNLPNEPISETELYFQNRFTDEQVVQMIKDHSYNEKLHQMKHLLQLHKSTEQGEPNLQQLDNLLTGSSTMYKEHLFHKELTGSDIGSLNRLLIPIQHARHHFPTDILDNNKYKFLKFIYNEGK